MPEVCPADESCDMPETIYKPVLNRRELLGRMTSGIGLAAIGSIVSGEAGWAGRTNSLGKSQLGITHHLPRAKNIIFLHQSGGPSQVDLFDNKPKLKEMHATELPEEVRMEQRLTTMTSEQASKPLTASQFKFHKHGDSGIELSESGHLKGRRSSAPRSAGRLEKRRARHGHTVRRPSLSL